MASKPEAVENYATNMPYEDSGNFSCSSTTSDDVVPRQQAQLTDLQWPQKEQNLFTAMQDVRKLRSELERLSKSEQWYKQELKSQKSTRLEILERLYTQERKYMRENQRLQEECLRLYTKCTELEQAAQQQQQRSERSASRFTDSDGDGAYDSNIGIGLVIDGKSESEFEIKQQQSIISDQCQLIEVLRKQKKQLLDDLQHLSHEHSAKMLGLQHTLASMELENKCVTSKCKQLLLDKSSLELRLEEKTQSLCSLTAEREKLRHAIDELNETHEAQEKLLALKEQEYMQLKRQYNTQLQDETNPEEVHRLSLAYHTEINTKTTEIATLKMSLQQLQIELENMADLETRNEQQTREIEQLSFALESQRFEHDNLMAANKAKSEQIDELSVCLERTRNEQEAALNSLREAQKKTKQIENELMALHKQYANMCALCESTKFKLELQRIETGKLKCQTDCDAREIEQLRVSLKQYLHKTAELSQRIGICESQLDSKSNELIDWRRKWQQKVEEVENMQQEVDKAQKYYEENQTQKTELMTKMCQTEDLAPEINQEATAVTHLADNAAQTDFIEDSSADCENCKVSQVELNDLKEKIINLEQKLQIIETEKRRTLSLLQQLLQQQEQKSTQLNAFHADWEDLLQAMQATQQFEEQMRAQLQLKTVELEELNALFAAQNEELQQLQKLAYLSECKRDKEFQEIKTTFQQQIETLNEENKLKTAEYEQLKIESEQLQSSTKMQIDELLKERERNAMKIEKLETELVKLQDKQTVIGQDMSDEWARALTKLLENESGRKLNRNDFPTMVRSLKRLLRNAKNTKIIRRGDDIQILKRQLEDLRNKYEHSQQCNKLLEQALQTERKKFEASDYGKYRTQPQHEPAHEVANLMDDYKKLTLQSADATGRLRTSAILDLIERSNHCQPNLLRLNSSVADFRENMQQLVDILANVELNNCRRDTCSSDGIPSLMEELRAIAEKL